MQISIHTVLSAVLALPSIAFAQAAPHARGGAQTVAIDTTAGRLTCRIERQGPAAEQFQKAVSDGKYNGVFVTGITDGIAAQGQGDSGSDPTSAENTRSGLERAGVLGMAVTKGQMSATRFVILEHGDLEYKSRVAPFGLCDEATVGKVQTISHDLLVAANRAAVPVVINKVFVTKQGEALPPVTPNGPPVTPIYPPKQDSGIPAPDPTGPTAVIETSMGSMTCRLFTETKEATANFVGLAKGTKPWRSPVSHAMMHDKPFYNGLHFDRVIPDFMIEQGDLPGDNTGDGSIGIRFGNEIVPGLTFDRPGRLAYANSGPGTNASEFFITSTPQPALDGSFTIFGQCDPESVKVADAIAAVSRDAKNKPLKPVTVRKITIK